MTLQEKLGDWQRKQPEQESNLMRESALSLRTESASSREKIVVDGEEVDDFEEFTYLVTIVDKEGGGSKDITHRL